MILTCARIESQCSLKFQNSFVDLAFSKNPLSCDKMHFRRLRLGIVQLPLEIEVDGRPLERLAVRVDRTIPIALSAQLLCNSHFSDAAPESQRE